MASATRSSRKLRDEDSASLKKKRVGCKSKDAKALTGSGSSTSAFGLRRSSREIPSKKKRSSSPTTRKSERIEKRSVLPFKRKGKKVDKQTVPSPPRRPEKSGNHHYLSSSSSKSSEKGSISSNLKKKKQKNEENQKKEENMKLRASETKDQGKLEKQDQKCSGVVLKTKMRLDARSYRASFKPQGKKIKQLDASEKQKRDDNLSREDRVKEGTNGSKKVEEGIRGSTLKKKDEEALDRSSSSLKKRVAGTLEDNGGKSKLSRVSKKRKFGVVAHKSKCGDNSLPSKSSASLLQSSPDGLQEKKISDEGDGPKLASKAKEDKSEAINDAATVEVGCSAKEDLPLPELMLSSCGRRSQVQGVSLETASEIRPSKRKRDDASDLESQDRGTSEVGGNIRIVEEHENSSQPKDSSLDTQQDTGHDRCDICKLGGKLLCCDGKGCKRSYHLSCLDLSLEDFPFRTWHCLHCVKKRVEYGVHSVSGGIESIWDDREVEASNCEGMQKEKQYLVKYEGLAHVHNRWIPEDQLLHEAPVLVAEYRGLQNKKVVRWKPDWTVPQRLVQKRLVMPSKQVDEYFAGSCCDVSGGFYEWLVKWKGLGYEHATWELQNAPFLSSPEAKMLMQDYENRHEKAKKSSKPPSEDKVLQERKGSFSKLPKLPSDLPPGLDNDHLNCFHKLRDYWHKCHNAVIIDEQERIIKVILFVLSLQSYVCRPFLILSTSSGLPAWEDELLRLAPSISYVVYSGSKDVRKYIRLLEFFKEGGCMMFQVLLSSPEAVVEDFEALSCLGWEAIIVDESQNPVVSNSFEQMRMLSSDFRLLLFGGQLKDSIAEYHKLLAFLDSRGNGVCDTSLKDDSSHYANELAALKERFAWYLLYERKSDFSKFVEYWVPVQLSKVQLEQYCASLLANSISLRSCSKVDPVGALPDILISTRKCCDHPYLVDASLQTALTKGHPEKSLDIGVDASGKLQLLDKVLPELKNRGLRVLILFQSIGGSGRNPIGDYLDDYMRLRFGPDSYERIDSGLVTSKRERQAALNNFNDRERGRFVFLIENRACHSSIKLSAVDTIIIFDSDWNPLNDARALQKINIDSQFKQLKVFRLYSSCTVEEKVLIFAKQDMTLESNIQNLNVSTSHMLLTWGASYLFNKLDEFHGCQSPSLASNSSPERSLLDGAVSELLAQLNHDAENNSSDNCSVILRVKQSGATYSRNISLLGELELLSTDEEPPHVFWSKLLEGRNPQWRYLPGSSQRVRKKVQYFDELPEKPGAETDEIRKKRKKVANANIDPLSLDTWVEDKCSQKKPQLLSSNVNKESGASGSQAPANLNDPSHASRVSPTASEVSEAPEDNMVGLDGSRKLRDGQKSLHLVLKPKILQLCETLKLPDDVKNMSEWFLDYIMNNLRVNSEPETILQAFQISVCWVAASFLKFKVDYKESLALAKQQLNFECQEELVVSVYSKLRKLKKRIKEANPQELPRSATTSNSQECLSSGPGNNVAKGLESYQHEHETAGRKTSAAHNFLKELSAEKQAPGSGQANMELNKQHGNGYTPSHHNEYGSQKIKFLDERIRQIEEVCAKRAEDIIRKQKEETTQFMKLWERKREKLKREHSLESYCIRTMHKDPSIRSDELKKANGKLEREMLELKKRMWGYQRKLVDMQREARAREKQMKACWLEDAKSGRLSESFSELPLSDTGFRLERMETCEQGVVNAMPMCCPSSEPQNLSAVVSAPARLSSEPQNLSAVVSAPARLSSEPQNLSAVVSTPLKLTAPSRRSAEAPVVVQNEVAEGIPAGTETLATHISSVNGVSSENAEGSNASLKRGEMATVEQIFTVVNSSGSGVMSSSQLNQAELASLEQDHTSPDQNNSSGAGVLQHSRKHNSDGAGSISSPHENQGELPFSEQPPMALGCDNSVAIAVVQHSRQDSSDGAHLIASPQQCLAQLPSLDNCSMSSGIADSLISHQVLTNFRQHQVPSVNHNQPPIFVGEREHVTGCEGQSSSHRIEAQTMHSADYTSIQAEQSNGSVSISCPVIEMQLPVSASTDAHSVEHIEPRISTSIGGEHEPRHGGFSSSQQMEVEGQQMVGGTPLQTEQFNHAVSQSMTQLPAMDPRVARMLLDSTHLAHPFPTTAPRPQVLHHDPLQNELAGLRREEERIVKMQEDVKNRLIADCEREIEEVRRKYETLIQNSENIFLERRRKIETDLNKVAMNLRLADAFKLKFAEVRSRSTPRNQVPAATTTPITTTMQQLPMQSLPQTAQRLPQVLAPPVQVHQSSVLLSGNPTTAPQFSPIIPSRFNLQHNAEVRTPAPHLQQFRPRPISMPNHLPSYSGMPIQQSISSSVAAPPPPLQLPPTHQIVSSGTSSAGHLPDISGVLPVFHNPSLSALELLMDVDRRSISNLQNLPELSMSLDSCIPSNLSACCVQGTAGTGTARPAEVVCLSDDDL